MTVTIAWILWSLTLYGWQPQRGYDTYAACMRLADIIETREEVAKKANPAYEPNWPACFPHTFDPRLKGDRS